jgi:hypothetical protein
VATAAATLEIISDDVNDTAEGSGARSVIIEGLDANWQTITEEVATNGTSASTATTKSFLRVSRAYVEDAGTYAGTILGGNTGTITIRISSAGATQATIAVESGFGVGQTQIARYSVPDNNTAYILSYKSSVDSTNGAHVYLFKRMNANTIAAPFSSRRLVLEADQDTGVISHKPQTAYGPFPEFTDIWWAAIRSGGSNSSVDIEFEILLVNDDNASFPW